MKTVLDDKLLENVSGGGFGDWFDENIALPVMNWFLNAPDIEDPGC